MGWRPGQVSGFFWRSVAIAMTSEAELSLGWANEVCPYAQVN